MVNVAARIWSNAIEHPRRAALRSSHGDLSYGDLVEAASRVAGALRDAGIQSLDRVVLVAPSVIEFPIAYYGLHAVGATVITMNTMSTIPEIAYVVEDSEPALVVAWHESADAAKAAATQAGVPFWTIEPGAEFAADPVRSIHNHDVDDAAIILYTSGTTGRPKGVELTAGNLIAATEAVRPVLGLDQDDRVGTALPLFHVYGQVVIMNTVLVTGASLSVLSPFDPGRMLDLISRDRLSVVAGVPTMWNAMLHVVEGYGPTDFEALRLASSGGASLPIDVISAFRERFGCTILEGYGLTETAGVATFNDVTKGPKAGTVGPAMPGVGVEVRDPEGRVLEPGEVGEIFLRGATVMKRYRNRPEATDADLRDGWLRTGDLGLLDDDGYLSIVDRTKDLIIRGGYNVYPREVEEVLYEHPDIVEVAVVGVPDEHFGEEVAAVIALRPGVEAAVAELRDWAKTRLSAYKVPRLYQFVDDLPKGATGKILKREIDRDLIRTASPRASA